MASGRQQHSTPSTTLSLVCSAFLPIFLQLPLPPCTCARQASCRSISRWSSRRCSHIFGMRLWQNSWGWFTCWCWWTWRRLKEWPTNSCPTSQIDRILGHISHTNIQRNHFQCMASGRKSFLGQAICTGQCKSLHQSPRGGIMIILLVAGYSCCSTGCSGISWASSARNPPGTCIYNCTPWPPACWQTPGAYCSSWAMSEGWWPSPWCI